MQRSNLVLIGMPGAGKSTTGVLIAKELGKNFIDVDLLIQEREEALLQEIIDRVGFNEFLVIEERVLLNLDVDNAVIAPGGSVIYSEKAVEHLKKSGLLVYLKLDYGEIERRISNIASRGIVFGAGKGLPELYEERTVLYEKYADLVIECSGLSIEDVTQEIVRSYNGFLLR